MPVYKRFQRKPVKRGDKNYNKGTWYYRFKLRGQLYHKSIPEITTKAQAEAAEQSAKNAIFENRYELLIDTTTFEQFTNDVYFRYIEQNNINVYSKNIFTNVLLDYFGKMLLREISPDNCRQFIENRKRTKTIHGKTRKPASINKELSTLSKIFNLAREERKLEINPMQYISKLKESKSRDRILTDDERKRFDEEIAKDKILYRLSTIAMHTGLRKGQILAIRLKDVDFKRGILNAIASKGRESRYVPLNQTMIRLFKEIESEKPKNRIFPFKDFRKRWDNAMSKASIEDFTFHDLKHQFGTELVKRGESPELVKLLFAHSDMAITSKYINREMELMQSAVARLDDVQELGSV